MKVGERARVTRVFSQADQTDYARISGHAVTDNSVSEPLIGALFSFLLGVKLPGRGAMYLKQETSYQHSAVIGESLIAEVEITGLRPDKKLVDLSTICRRADGSLVASGRALVYMGDADLWTDEHG